MPTQVGIHDLLAATKKIVDADLRQHDDVANSGASMVSSVGIRTKFVRIEPTAMVPHIFKVRHREQ